MGDEAVLNTEDDPRTILEHFEMRAREDQAMRIADSSEPIPDSRILPDGEAYDEIEAAGREAASEAFKEFEKQMNLQFNQVDNAEE